MFRKKPIPVLNSTNDFYSLLLITKAVAYQELWVIPPALLKVRMSVWFYIIIAILNWLVPVYFIRRLVDNSYLFENGDSKIVIGIGLLLLGSLLASWLGFQLWWHRKDKLKETSSHGDEFVATPVFAHLFQTIGEWLGVWIFIIGLVVGVVVLFGSSDAAYALGLEVFTSLGFAAILIAPIASFFVLLYRHPGLTQSL